MEKQIFEELKEIKLILMDHTKTLTDHTTILNDHTRLLNDHTKLLNDHTRLLNDHTRMLNEHSEVLHLHGETLKEHGHMLSALRTGQEEIKAEIDGMKIQNAKEFGEIKERLNNTEASIEVLKNENFINKTDIYRMKTTMGMK